MAKHARQTFVTSRELEYFTVDELTKQTGHGLDEWHLVIVKELLDNSLDNCETHGIPPVIKVTVDGSTICVEDNGSGMPEEVIRASVDFTVRVSDKFHYPSPTRGAQGNGLKTVFVMPFVFGSDSDQQVVVESDGTQYSINISLDEIAQKPLVEITTAPSDVKSGTSVKVSLASSLTTEQFGDILHFCESAVVLNPHLSLSLSGFGEDYSW